MNMNDPIKCPLFLTQNRSKAAGVKIAPIQGRRCLKNTLKTFELLTPHQRHQRAWFSDDMKHLLHSISRPARFRERLRKKYVELLNLCFQNNILI
jgi:hypothetical protein